MGLGLSGLRLGLGQQLWGTVWSPANLFPTGTEEGLFLDFSDISTLYTDQTFATNISSIGDPVGGVLDKSGNGNHLVQATAAARPIWTRHPKSGVRNLVDNSGTLTAGTWILSDATLSGGVSDPDGGSTAYTLTATGANGQIARSWNAPSSSLTYVSSWYVRRRTGTGTVYLVNPNGGGITSVSVTSEWSRVQKDGLGGASNSFCAIRCATSGDEIDIWHPQFELGSTATDYQSRVSQYDVTEAGSDDCYGLTFDGVDDYMVTAANLDLSGTDEVTLTAGVYATTPTTERWIFAHNNNELDNSLNLRAPPTSGTGRYAFRVAGNVSVGKDETFPSHNVVTGISSLNDVDNANVCIVRVDGASGDVNAIGATPTLFDTAIASIGASNTGGGTRLVGTLYGVTLTDYILDAEQLAELETWTAARTPEVTLA